MTGTPSTLPDPVRRRLLALCEGRPLVVFDIEATGADRLSDRIVELAAIRLEPPDSAREATWRVSPGIRIPKESTAIHGIRDEDVQDLPPFAEVAAEVAAFFEGADLAGYSLRGFDLPALQKEMERANVPFSMEGRRIVDGQTIYFKKEPRDLTAALRLFAGREHTGAHGALADAIASAEVLVGELARYPDLPSTLDGLHVYSRPAEGRYVDPDKRFVWRDGKAVLAFGEYRGVTLEEVAAKHPAFLDWVLSRDFSAETKRIVREAQKGIFPAR